MLNEYLTWLTLWKLVLATFTLATIAVILFLITLPPSYSHFHPGIVTADQFSEQDRKDEARSGWQLFQQRKDDTGSMMTKTTVQVVVLGDIGRSPRMQYHALSLVRRGVPTQIVGYNESELLPDLQASRFAKVIALPKYPSILQPRSKLLFTLLAPLKVMYQAWTTYYTLAYRTKASRFMLVQNPPSIPTLAIAIVVCFFRNTRLVVDWHNLGYSILAIRLGTSHPLVRIARYYEFSLSRAAHGHFTVTDAMQRMLKSCCGIEAVTLHDRPANQFQPLTMGKRKEFLRRCEVTKPLANEIMTDQRKLIISSTSWTPDEDFDLLLDALLQYSQHVETDEKLPNLLVVITGKGPLKDSYKRRIESLESSGKLHGVVITTAWMSIDDYASILASADLGICLHTSSSGVDLPMKVLDMFGAGLPVAGWCKYEAWSELVTENVNGLGFASPRELYTILQVLFKEDVGKLKKLREGAVNEGKTRWEHEWDRVATKVLRLDT